VTTTGRRAAPVAPGAIASVRPEERADADLLAASDRSAFAEVYRRHRGVVRAYAGRLVGCANLADDLAADTFVIALRQKARFDSRVPSARPWLLGIARNGARRSFRQRAIEDRAAQRYAAGCCGTDADPQQPRAIELDPATCQILRDGMDRLPAGVRAAVVLRAVHHLGYEEIAHRLGCSPGAVRTRVCRGLAQLASDDRLRAAWLRAVAL
jgi:RNA polymerase sigma-70 factor (ECF subfamily)